MNCWQEIGVQGDLSCPQLQTHGHCHHCPTYQAAAARLLETPLSEADMAEAAAALSREQTAPVARPLSVVIFRSGSAWLALPSLSVQEIVAPRAIHSLPHRRNGTVLGLTNIRGELLICVALPFVLGLEADAGAFPHTARMLVVRQDGGRLVFPADEVAAVERFPAHVGAPVPPMIAKAAASFTKVVLDWQKKPVSLLDENALLASVNRSLALATAI